MSPLDSLYDNCTKACESWPACTVCGKTKAPIGRSLPLEACGGYCDDDCPGYRQAPRPGHLFPGELARIREDQTDG